MRARLAAAFADAIGPDAVSTDCQALAPHLTDWRGTKTGHADLLLKPRTRDQVQALVRTAGALGVALVPQGGNTGLVGGSVPEPASGRPVALVSMQRMAAIRRVDAAALTLEAEAGAILETVHRTAEAAGARFPLSLGAKGSATIGGLVSTNAGGTQVLRHGTMRARVLGLEAVLADGSVLDQLAPLPKDNSGYDLKQLLIGAEGTLGIVTAASLRLAPAMQARAVAWIGMPSADAALALLGRLRGALGDRVESFELITAAALELVVARVSGARPPLASAHPFHALCEVEARDEALAIVLADALAAGEAGDATIAASGAQADAFWRLREDIPEAERLEGGAIKNDVSVPVAAVPALHAEAVAMAARDFAGSRPLVFGHLGDGNLHWNLRPPTGVDPKAWVARHGEEARRRLHDLVREHGGSISAEHGIGTLKLAELQRLGDPGKLTAMRAVKAALDPLNIMNPGKLVAPVPGLR